VAAALVGLLMRVRPPRGGRFLGGDGRLWFLLLLLVVVVVVAVVSNRRR
jgi:hypothetical protein